MKKSVLVIAIVLMIGSIGFVNAQEQPKPKKDTVNMDTEAKPTFYYAVEDEKAEAKDADKGGFPIIPVIAGVVVVGAAAAFFVMKKKK